MVNVSLSGPTGYRDHPAIPRRLARQFQIAVFDKGEAGGEVRHSGVAAEGADDVVSETIESHGVWEPADTILVLDWCARVAAKGGGRMLDLGCQIGWFSLLAGLSGLDVVAIDGNSNALRLLEASWYANQIRAKLVSMQQIIDDRWFFRLGTTDRVALLKADLEGSEAYAVEALGSYIDEGRIDRILMEISPVFNDSYGAILRRLIDAGYAVFTVPDKQHPPANASHTEEWLRTFGTALHGMRDRLLDEWLPAQHQFNIWAEAPS